MNQREMVEQLAKHPLLNGLSNKILKTLAMGVKPFAATANEYLGRDGTPSHAFYLLRSGHVSLEIPTANRGVVSIQTVGPGDILGWSWLVPPHRWKFDCRAKDSVKGFMFDAAWLREKCDADPELGLQLLKRLLYVIANRLAATRVQLLDLYQ